MGFISSDNILVFPCGRRHSDYDITARLTTEYNLVSIINKLVDRESFIVTDVDFTSGITAENETTLFCFNIGGYLFTTTPKDIFDAVKDSSATNIYAYINKNTLTLNDDGNINQELVELAAFTSNGNNIDTSATLLDSGAANAEQFVGVNFIGADTKPEGMYISLHLFTKKNSCWYFVEDSKIKFETNKEGTHRSVRIDDGELN